MATNQTFGSYPTFGGTTAQQKNYQSGGGGIMTTQQFRSPGGTLAPDDQRTFARKQQITTQQQPTAAPAPKPPPPGVPTQAPSPTAAPRPQMAPPTPSMAPAPPGSTVTSQAPAGQAPGGGLVNLAPLINQLVQNPSMARRQGAEDTFRRLTGVMQERLGEDAARRGLEFSSVPTELFGEQAGQLAAQMQEAEAQASADDFARALGIASGFGQQQFDNQLGLRDQDLQELLSFHGIGQTDFQNQMALRDDFYRQLQLLMGLGQYANDPLDLAVGSGFDYSGALGDQAGGWADILAQAAGSLPFLQGGAQQPGTAPQTTPPFVPPGYRPPGFGIDYGIGSRSDPDGDGVDWLTEMARR